MNEPQLWQGPSRSGAALPTQAGASAVSTALRQAMQAPPAFDLIDTILTVLRQRAWLIASLTIGLTALVAVALALQPPRYTAVTEVVLESREGTDYGNLEENTNYQRNPLAPADMETQLRVLSSFELLVAVVDELGLEPEPVTARPWTGFVEDVLRRLFPTLAIPSFLAPEPPPSAAEKRERILREVRDNLQLTRDPLARVLTIAYTARSPELAAEVANAFARQFLSQLIEAQRRNLAATASVLEQQRDLLRDKAEEAERAVRQFQNERNLVDVQGESAASLPYADLSRQLADAEADLARAEARAAQVAGASGTDLAGIPEALSSTVLTTLQQRAAEAEARFASLSADYGPRHPLVREAERSRQEVRAAVGRELGKIARQVRGERDVARARVENLRTALARVEKDVTTTNASRVELQALQSQAQTARRLYETMIDRYERAYLQQFLVNPGARVISAARAPSEPDRRGRVVLLGLGAIASFGFACALAFLLELARQGYSSGAALAADTGLSVIGTLPDVPGRNAQLEVADLRSDLSHGLFSESIRRVAFRLKPGGAAPGQVVLVTSALPDEGKSTFALCLARQLSAMRLRVLLVDADVYRRQVTARMQASPGNTPDLHDVLTDESVTLAEAIRRDQRLGFDVLPSFPPPANFRMVDHADRFGQLLDELRRRYDVVILDTPPILSLSDYAAAAPVADAVAMVVRWRRTPRRAVRAALRQIAALAGPLPMLVLNRVPLRHSLADETDPLGFSVYSKRYYGA